MLKYDASPAASENPSDKTRLFSLSMTQCSTQCGRDLAWETSKSGTGRVACLHLCSFGCCTVSEPEPSCAKLRELAKDSICCKTYALGSGAVLLKQGRPFSQQSNCRQSAHTHTQPVLGSSCLTQETTKQCTHACVSGTLENVARCKFWMNAAILVLSRQAIIRHRPTVSTTGACWPCKHARSG